MKHSQEEILNALKVIKETCDENNSCKECPFSSVDHDCRIENNEPASWNIDGESKVWKALH